MGWVDLSFLVVLGLSVAVGLWRGLVYEVLALGGWLVAYVLSPWLAPVVQGWLPEERMGPQLSHAAGLVLAFIVILVVWSLVARLVRALIQASPLSWLDRLGGGGFGALRGLFIGLLVALLVGMTPLVTSEPWRASALAPWLQGGLRVLQPLLPESVNKFIPA
ncbi:CvpA family protein [Pelomonas sp. APW6]|uniref:CvpA family protein n=1 Tax=Roseateles subflavus TaxID=3053353 RepID=A0ABT7LPD5_9BURK|nr:CvpA family protein [Pelomonas sp. APW6]MDL5034015.1 CvpA family protein [Pelomonas sp. APW6]